MSPFKPKKPCSYPACKNLTNGGPCPEHKRKANRRYDKERDKTSERRFLHSTRWRRIAKAKLDNDPLCERCCPHDEPAILVHHKDGNPLNNPEDGSNHESLCMMHHEDEHKGERWGHLTSSE